MRNLLAVSLLVALLAAPSLGIINVKLTADGPIVDGKVQLNNGQTTTVYLWGQATTGLFSLGGDIKAATIGPSVLTSVSSSLVFGPEFRPHTFFSPTPGTAGSSGGWNTFGSMQTDESAPAHPEVGAIPNWVLFCQYTVTAAPTGTGDTTLTFLGKTVTGYKPIETNKTGIIGSNTPLTIHVTPEPATLVLLTLGGLLAGRRRK